MGVASGFAAALSLVRAARPAGDARSPRRPRSSPGGRCRPPPSALEFAEQWRPDLLWILICATMLFSYAAGVLRLRRRGDRWPIHRSILWTLGVLVLAWLTNGGLNTYEKYLFSAHMIAAHGADDAVPLLLVPAAPITLALRAIASATDGTRGVREWMLLAVHSRVSGVLANPVVAGRAVRRVAPASSTTRRCSAGRRPTTSGTSG